MDLKAFQQRVIEDVEQYLRVLADERARGNVRHAGKDAWRDDRLRGLNLGRYEERENGLGEDLPTFCIKVPTGGGKTLLATQILGSIYRTLLTDRRGAGLVLWVVPSSQIYRDTLKRLRDRNDLYRIMLEHAVSRRIEVWEKDEIKRLTPVRLAECLNILVVQLASTNRETREQLKFFKESGGNIVQHFPPEDDYGAHRALKEKLPNLEMLVEDEASGQYLVKTSVGNLVAMCRPPVILDEGHKATSQLARSTIERFNASIVVELSATPHHGANILSRVSGQELLDAEMIKLPLNIAISGLSDWKAILTQARDKRDALAEKAVEHMRDAGESTMIRPIVLVQVERTGRDQRGRGYIHSEDVREYLMQRLSIPETAIKVKTAHDDGLEDVDLMDPACPVEWIITKSALQEGWDCPFAYILVSLHNMGSARAMTQLVGRILRQPYQERIGTPEDPSELDQSYVYCLKETAREVAKQVKNALESEGYEGDLEGVVRDATGREAPRMERTIRIKESFSSLYTRPFEGEIYLPRFCVREGDEYVPLDYFEHLIAQVNVADFTYDKIEWTLADAVRHARNHYYTVTLGSFREERSARIDSWERDEQVLAWMVAHLGMQLPYLSFKQLRLIVERVYQRLIDWHLTAIVKDHLALVKTEVASKTEEFIREETDRLTETAFDRLFDTDRIQFYLECKHCRFQIPPSVQIHSLGPLTPLTHDDGSDVAKSLFDFTPNEGQNQYERKVALCLDKHADVLWWFRNRVGKEYFAVQGYKRNRIYPDFVVKRHDNGRDYHDVLVVESKGEHLEGHPDTTYKRKVAGYFERAGHRVSWQQLGEEFKDHIFRFQVLDEAQPLGRNWADELTDLLSENA